MRLLCLTLTLAAACAPRSDDPAADAKPSGLPDPPSASQIVTGNVRVVIDTHDPVTIPIPS